MHAIGLLFLLAIGFAMLPIDAQYWLIGLVRPLWSTETGQMIMLGLLGGVIGAMLAANLIWNAAMHAVYLEDLKRADDTYQRRRK